jgi:Linear amide C-N hydrolases, choloylglycine hydrolase family
MFIADPPLSRATMNRVASDSLPVFTPRQGQYLAFILYLSTAQYTTPDPKKLSLSVAAWPQYVLDNYASVDEAVKGLEGADFQLLPPNMPGGYAATMHLAISDASGDSAILERLWPLQRRIANTTIMVIEFH